LTLLKHSSEKLELIAPWDLGRDIYSFAISKELNADVFTFSRGHEDRVIVMHGSAVQGDRPAA
jgi:hypothetical protein